MRRQRKMWVSDAYAMRQARFMQLPVAKIERPLRTTLMHTVAMFRAFTKGSPTPEQIAALRWSCQPIIRAAKAGDGAAVRRWAAMALA